MSPVINYFIGIYLMIGLLMFISWVERTRANNVKLKYTSTYLILFAALLFVWPVMIYKALK